MVVVGVAIAGLVLVGNIKTTWSFSAFTILVYYAITNFCALRLPADQRLYPRWIAIVGLVACLGLAFFRRAHDLAQRLGIALAWLVLALRGAAPHGESLGGQLAHRTNGRA